MKVRNHKYNVTMKDGQVRTFKTWSTANSFCKSHPNSVAQMVLVKG